MKERLTNEILEKMQYLPQEDKERLRHTISLALNNFEVTLAKNEIVEWNLEQNYELLRQFLIAKKVEGCSDRTIEYYKLTIKNFLDKLSVPLQEVATSHIRFFIATREMQDHVSKTTQNNERRILSSFFGWLTAEEYINKNPMLRVAAIKGKQKKKKAFSDMEVEKIRNAVVDAREKAIIETLLSTGCRVGGLVGMDISRIEGDSIVVCEKGDKERTVYFNAKAKLAIEEYLKTRTDDNDALFVSMDKPHDRLKISAIEIIVRELGKRAGVNPCHPHRFRRTCATMARKRGMPLEEIQKLLGHSNIDTTMIYISQDEESLQIDHKKYIV